MIRHSRIKEKQEGHKAQSLVIGFMLILALSIALLGWFQITQLPEINRDSEISFENDVSTDMNDFRSALWEVTQDPETEVRPVSIKTVVEYPLQSSKTDASTAQLEFSTISTNAYSFQNSDPINVVDSDVSSTKIEHIPTYFVRDPSTTIIENNVVARRTGSGINKSIGSQLMVSENEIYITQLNVDESSIVSQDPEFVLREVDRDVTTMTATDNTTDIIMEAETTLQESFWKDEFENINSVDETGVIVNNGTLNVPLDPSQSYEVHISRINLDTN